MAVKMSKLSSLTAQQKWHLHCPVKMGTSWWSAAETETWVDKAVVCSVAVVGKAVGSCADVVGTTFDSCSAVVGKALDGCCAVVGKADGSCDAAELPCCPVCIALVISTALLSTDDRSALSSSMSSTVCTHIINSYPCQYSMLGERQHVYYHTHTHHAHNTHQLPLSTQHV